MSSLTQDTIASLLQTAQLDNFVVTVQGEPSVVSNPDPVTVAFFCRLIVFLSRWLCLAAGKLLDRVVDWDTLRRASLVLRPKDFEEMVQERQNMGVCGYPRCPRQLASGHRVLYRVSVSERKIFKAGSPYCSRGCSILSLKYSSILSEDPLFLRDLSSGKAGASRTRTRSGLMREKQKQKQEPDSRSAAAQESTPAEVGIRAAARNAAPGESVKMVHEKPQLKEDEKAEEDEYNTSILLQAPGQTQLASLERSLSPRNLVMGSVMHWCGDQTRQWLMSGGSERPVWGDQSNALSDRRTAIFQRCQPFLLSLQADLSIDYPNIQSDLLNIVRTLVFNRPLPALAYKDWKLVSLFFIQLIALKEQHRLTRVRRLESQESSWWDGKPTDSDRDSWDRLLAPWGMTYPELVSLVEISLDISFQV